MTLAQIRAAMAAKNLEIRAKLDEILALPLTAKVPAALDAAHDALVAEYDALAQREAQTVRSQPMHYGAGARAPGGERATRNSAIEGSLLHRHNPDRYELTPAAREYRGLSLTELARDVLEASGQTTRGDSRVEIATRSLMSTSDFPGILANVTGRTLRDSYAAAPRTFLPLARRVALNDFKAAHRVKLGEAPQLLEVVEGGEFKRGTMVESDETIKLRTYGRVVGITRQVIINDDLGAFTRVPELYGAAAANLESNVVWGLILSNPTLLTDNTALFHAKHNNLVASGAGAASPSVTTLSAARVAMSKQTGNDGATILNVRPKYIVVPTEMEIGVQQLLYGVIAAPNAAGAVPEAIRTLTPISEPRLSMGVNGIAGSATAWYVFADPSLVDTIEYAYLEGQDGPYTETRNGFDIDGIEVKCRHDFGAAAIDYRGVYRNAGA